MPVKITLLCWLLLSATSAKTQTRIDSLKEITRFKTITKEVGCHLCDLDGKILYSSDTLYRYTLMAKEIADKLNDPDKKTG